MIDTIKTITFGLFLAIVILFNGCVGVLTGHDYKTKDFVVMYKVVKAGVQTYMTREQIEKAKLDKADIVVTDVYKVVKGNGVNSH